MRNKVTPGVKRMEMIGREVGLVITSRGGFRGIGDYYRTFVETFRCVGTFPSQNRVS